MLSYCNTIYNQRHCRSTISSFVMPSRVNKFTQRPILKFAHLKWHVTNLLTGVHCVYSICLYFTKWPINWYRSRGVEHKNVCPRHHPQSWLWYTDWHLPSRQARLSRFKSTSDHLKAGAFIPIYQWRACAMLNFRGIFLKFNIVNFGEYKHFLFNLCRHIFLI